MNENLRIFYFDQLKRIALRVEELSHVVQNPTEELSSQDKIDFRKESIKVQKHLSDTLDELYVLLIK